MIRPFGKIIFIGMLSTLLLMPNVYANPEVIDSQKNIAADGAAKRSDEGTIVPEDERTFQVALVLPDGSLWGEGAIIDDSWMITTANTFIYYGKQLQVLSGTKTLDQGGTLHSIAEIRTHPMHDYDASEGYDIALVKIDGTFPENLERLKLATPSMMSTHGTPGTGAAVSGWRQNPGYENISNRLMQAVNPIIDDTQCQQQADNIFIHYMDEDTTICTRDQGHSPCVGGSGQPLTISRDGELYGAGIASWGDDHCDGFMAYTETANLLNWIDQFVDINSSSGELQPGTYRISSDISDRGCMDVKDGSIEDGAPILQWWCHNDDNQKWQIEAVGENYRMVAVHSGQVLDVPVSSTEENVGVIQWPWNGGENQQWRITPFDDGSYEIVNVNSDLCLDVKNASSQLGEIIQQYGCHGRDNQRWRFELVE